jgi:UDP-3-O-[3-hydroxymyristoyl] N-acetylglucosamine deacetylase
MCLQKTIRTPIQAQGVGVHSGKITTLTLKPAKENTGVIFKRIDTLDQIEIPATYNNVIDTRLSTCLGHKNQKVSTVEHLLSAISALGIDNLYVEVDNEEIPIMDGSASSFIFLLRSAGIINQKAKKKFIKLTKPITVQENEKTATLTPCSGFKIEVTIDFDHPQITNTESHIEIDFSTTSFIHEIARARTFGFMKDIEMLRSHNLALGGNLSNCVVLDENKVINKEGLRFKNELVRHKALDVIGDLYLLGMPLLAHFNGYKPGHYMNNLLAKKLFANTDCWRIETFDDNKCPIKFN